MSEERPKKKRFQPLEGEDLQWFLAQQKIIDKADAAEEFTDNPQDEAIEKEHKGTPELDKIALEEIPTRGPLTYRDLGTIINKAQGAKVGDRPANRTRPLDAYLRIICTYVNNVRGSELATQRRDEAEALEKMRKEKEGEVKGRKEKEREEGGQETDESDGSPTKKRKVEEEASGAGTPTPAPVPAVVEVEIGENAPSCAIIPSRRFDELRFKSTNKKMQEAAKKLLEEMDLTGSKFTELEFLFIPWVSRPGGGNNLLDAHVMLLGVAPKQKFAFVIDGMPQNNLDEDGKLDGFEMTHYIMRMLVLSELNSGSFTRNNFETYKDEWRLYGQWSYRSETTDDSPDGPQQSDFYTCGIFATTTAFCLAFGYDLNCWVQADLEAYKKHRMAVELRNGEFSGDYEYDLLKVPTIKGQKGTVPRNTLRPPSPPKTYNFETDTSDSGEESDNDEEREGSEVLEGEELAGGIEVSDSEAEVPQYGYEYIDPDTTEEEGSDGEDDDFETRTGLKRKFLYTKENLQAAMAWTPKTRPKVKDWMPFPAQFDEIFHKQAGFLYSAPDWFKFQDRKYSKKELKQACRDFRLVGWREWSRGDAETFTKWVFCEVGALMARKRGDAVQPLPGLGLTQKRRKFRIH